jgi:hypothetical protein
MERYLGLDVHAQGCMLPVPSQSGKRLKDMGVEISAVQIQVGSLRGVVIFADNAARTRGGF